MAPAIRRITAWGAVAAALAGVFALYTRPDVAVMLAEQFWACFGS
ncbi:hypothetical protein [Ramlibacter humi]|nr:hypothetical protein [Ramlibacter humi]